MPTTMFAATPLDCTLCNEKEGNCEFLEDGEKLDFDQKMNATGKPDFSAWWVKKYCTMTRVDEFTLYFPYVLLVMPIIMVAMEKGFIK